MDGPFPNPLSTKDLQPVSHYQPMLPGIFGDMTTALTTLAHFDAALWNEVVVTQRMLAQ